jgi:hypothetical protein
MISPLRPVLLLLMASVTSLSGAPVLEATRDPDFAAATALREPPTRESSPAVLRGVNGADAQKTSVRVRWNDDALFFLFDCADRRVVAPGRDDGMDHFRLGDTVEVFIGRRGEPGYAEFHATPAGKKSFYFFDGYRSRIAAPPDAVGVRVDAASTDAGWRAVISVPWSLLGGKTRGEAWDVFFGRYDYEAEDAAPVLSSFPAQRGPKPDFHRRADYGILRILP